VRTAVAANAPPDSHVLVVSHGDDRLLQLGEREARHFPQNAQGDYAGYHPSDSGAAIAELERLRKTGATRLVFPQTMFWWLGHYEELREHLLSRYAVVAEQPDTCVIFALDQAPASSDRVVARHPGQLESLADALLPQDALVAVAGAEPPVSANDHRRWIVLAAQEDMEQQLGRLRRQGVSFLVIGRDAFEWLDEHRDLHDHLRQSQRLVTRQENVCEIFQLAASESAGGSG